MPRGHSRGKHSQASLRRTLSSTLRRTLRPRRTALLAAAAGATALVVGAGIVATDVATPDTAASSPAAASISGSVAGSVPGSAGTPPVVRDERRLATSRSVERVPLVSHRVPKATGKLWTTAPLDLRTQPREKARTAGLLDSGKHVAVTGRRIGRYAEILIGRTPRWVTAEYLTKQKAPEAMGLSDAPCPDGSSIESALQPQSVKVYRAVCAAFPQLTTYGGQDGHGEHVNGEAIDFMVPDSRTGQQVADFVYAHRAELDLFDIIWSQHIWTVQRASEGFRPMEDRGSATANHYDHVHIKIN